jgi:hypothetical protein
MPTMGGGEWRICRQQGDFIKLLFLLLILDNECWTKITNLSLFQTLRGSDSTDE